MDKITLTKTLNRVSVQHESKAGKKFPGGKLKVGINVTNSNGEEVWMNALMNEADIPEQGNEYTFEAWEGDYGWEFSMPSWKDKIEFRLSVLEGKMSNKPNTI